MDLNRTDSLVKSYKTPSKMATAELIVKKSKFIANIIPVQNEDEVKKYVKELKERLARHNVYAYSLKDGKMHCYDDGEPSGSAGLPILQLLINQKITDCLVVVTRYFGGILLGFGGLIKAYTESAKLALQNAKVVNMYLYKIYDLTFEYDQSNTLNYLGTLNIKWLQKSYADKIYAKLAINIADDETNKQFQDCLVKYNIKAVPVNLEYLKN